MAYGSAILARTEISGRDVSFSEFPIRKIITDAAGRSAEAKFFSFRFVVFSTREISPATLRYFVVFPCR